VELWLWLLLGWVLFSLEAEIDKSMWQMSHVRQRPLELYRICADAAIVMVRDVHLLHRRGPPDLTLFRFQELT
jgi:hypothetical protein